MACSIFKKYSASLIIREIEIKITIRCHLTQVSWQLSERKEKMCYWGCGGKKKNPYTQLMEMWISVSIMEQTKDASENWKYNFHKIRQSCLRVYISKKIKQTAAPTCALHHCSEWPRNEISLNISWWMDKENGIGADSEAELVKLPPVMPASHLLTSSSPGCRG